MAKDIEKPMVSVEVMRCQGMPFQERIEFSITQLGVASRISNKLEEQLGVLWIENLRGKTRASIMALSNFGTKMMKELDDRLAMAGVKLEEDGTLTDLHTNGNGRVSAN
jgi:DNA-directed RNA polymerase alpha subunit